MRKYIFLIVTLLITIGIVKVEALQIGGTEFMTPSDFQLYNNVSLTNSTGITTTKGAFTGTGIVYGYGTVSTTTTGYGASWCMNSNIVFLQNYIYSVQIAVLNENNKSYNIVTNDNYDLLRLGYTLADASTHRNSTNILYFGAYYDNHGVYVDGNQMFNKAYVLNYLFTSKLNSQYICLPFRHTQNTSNEQEFFFGYKIDVIGQSDLVTNASISSAISSSGLASASSVAQVQSSINQVQQEINGINDTLTEDHNYNNNPSENIQGKDDIEDMTDAEENLFDSIDMSGANQQVSIDANTSSFIWNIVNSLRGMSTYIVLLITSILGIGIIKLVLNR